MIIFSQYLPSLFSGVLVTLKLVLMALSFGLILALILTAVAETGWILFRIPVTIFVFIIRGTPLLVQLFVIYYGSGQLSALRAGIPVLQ